MAPRFEIRLSHGNTHPGADPAGGAWVRAPRGGGTQAPLRGAK